LVAVVLARPLAFLAPQRKEAIVPFRPSHLTAVVLEVVVQQLVLVVLVLVAGEVLAHLEVRLRQIKGIMAVLEQTSVLVEVVVLALSVSMAHHLSLVMVAQVFHLQLQVLR
jgi:hypothetical protein